MPWTDPGGREIQGKRGSVYARSRFTLPNSRHEHCIVKQLHSSADKTNKVLLASPLRAPGQSALRSASQALPGLPRRGLRGMHCTGGLACWPLSGPHQREKRKGSSVVSDSTPWTAARQAPLSTGFSRQESWSGLLFPSPGGLPDQGWNLDLPLCRGTHCPLSCQWEGEVMLRRGVRGGVRTSSQLCA